METNTKENLRDFNLHDEILGKNPNGRRRKHPLPTTDKDEQRIDAEIKSENYSDDSPFILKGDCL